MADQYRRTIALERAEGAQLGVIRAVLATDGEASDGHVLSIRGGEVAAGIPLLFGHDASSGRANLGSWKSFTFKPHEIHGEAVIELEGAGEQRAWREDVAHMVAAGHIGAVSVRWEPIGKPIKRTALAPASPAYVDAERETDWAKLNGYYFPRWRALEGSIVTLGADKAALIQRSLETSGRVAELWREVVEELERDEGEPPSDEIVADQAEDDPEAEPVVDPPSVLAERAKVAPLTYEQALELASARMVAGLAELGSDMQRRMQEMFAAALGRRR